MIRPDGSASDAILTTLAPADRIPSVGVQLPAFSEPRLVAARCPCWTTGWCDDRGPHPEPATIKPERLTLWDQPAELWSERP